MLQPLHELRAVSFAFAEDVVLRARQDGVARFDGDIKERARDCAWTTTHRDFELP